MLRVQWVAREIERRIVLGEYAVGQRLPTEPELSSEFSVSRTTVRGAVSELQARGLVSREQGRGTFVRGTGRVQVSMMLEANLSVSDVIRGAGRKPGTTGLTVALEPAPPAVLTALRLPSGSKTIVVRRTRTADGTPTADSVDYLLEVPSLPLDRAAYATSIYELLEATHGQPVTTGIARIEARTPNPETAERLQVTADTALLVLSQTHELEDGRPVMYSVIFLRSDVVNLYVHRGSRENDAGRAEGGTRVLGSLSA